MHPHPDTPATPRFLPEYDNLLASHANRTRVIADDCRRRIMMGNGMRATVLLDGFVCGAWKIVWQGKTAVLVVEPFRKLSREERSSLSEEGIRLLRFSAIKATDHEIQFLDET
ncbi:hypothetical protein J2T14_005227 [Paenibacillus harenae]|nr:hypothetical protein [Paenibacillus harenae]